MSLRKKYGYGDIEGLISSELPHSLVSQSSNPKRKSIFKRQFIPDLFNQDNLARISKIASREKLIKLDYLYEISRAIGINQSIDDKCFKSDRFTRALTHKFSASVMVNERI